MTPLAPDAEVADLLRQVLAELGELRADVETIAASVSRLSRDELRLLQTALPLIALEVRGTAFATADLLDVPRLAVVLEGHSACSLAWLLKRASARNIAGLRVEPCGRDRCGALWTVTTFDRVAAHTLRRVR